MERATRVTTLEQLDGVWSTGGAARPWEAAPPVDGWPPELPREAMRELALGEVLFRAGSPARALYLVVRGAVRLEGGGRGGHGRVVAFQGPGEVVGEESLIGEPRLGTAVAAWSSVVREIDPAGAIPARAGELIVASLARQQRQAVLRIGEEPLPALARLSRCLQGLAARFGAADGRDGWLRLHVHLPHEVLARYAGLNRVTVTKEMRQLVREGAVCGSHGRYRVAPARLAEIEELRVLRAL